MRLSKEAVIIVVLVLSLFGLYSLDRVRLGHSVPDEKRYLQSTKEMAESGDYISPRYHGKLRFQKPILFYWFILASYKIFGVGIFSARFISVIASLLSIVLVYLLGRDLYGKAAGIFSALILSTSEVYFMYSRFATPDVTFILFIGASLYLFLKAYRGDIKGRFRYLYMYAVMALAMLTKGPLGFLYPMLAICLFLIIKKDRRAFKELDFPLGLLVFAAISAPWFIAMIALHGNEYIEKVWSLEVVKKLKHPSFGSGKNFLGHYFYSMFYYAGMVFARHLPWTIFLPASLASVRRRNPAQAKDGNGPALISAWFFAVFVSLVFVGSRESYYVLALSMPLSLFLGRYFSGVLADDGLSKKILFKLPFVFMAIACFLALFLWLGFMVYVLGKPALSLSLLLLLVPVFMIYAYRGKNKILLPLSFFVASFAFLGYFAGYIIPAVDKDPLLEVSAEIKAVIKPGDVVGVASDAISYHRLNVSLKDYKIIRADKRTIDRSMGLESKKAYIEDFLKTEDRRIFCAITKEDYYNFVDKELQRRLFLMDKTLIWKKFHKQDESYFKELFTYFLQGKREKVRDALKEEIYLLSNRSG